jgi:hypothetical protein
MAAKEENWDTFMKARFGWCSRSRPALPTNQAAYKHWKERRMRRYPTSSQLSHLGVTAILTGISDVQGRRLGCVKKLGSPCGIGSADRPDFFTLRGRPLSRLVGAVASGAVGALSSLVGS